MIFQHPDIIHELGIEDFLSFKPAMSLLQLPAKHAAQPCLIVCSIHVAAPLGHGDVLYTTVGNRACALADMARAEPDAAIYLSQQLGVPDTVFVRDVSRGSEQACSISECSADSVSWFLSGMDLNVL